MSRIQDEIELALSKSGYHANLFRVVRRAMDLWQINTGSTDGLRVLIRRKRIISALRMLLDRELMYVHMNAAINRVPDGISQWRIAFRAFRAYSSAMKQVYPQATRDQVRWLRRQVLNH